MTAINKQRGRRKIEELLPWHATQSLSRRDADRVEQALAGDRAGYASHRRLCRGHHAGQAAQQPPGRGAVSGLSRSTRCCFSAINRSTWNPIKGLADISV